MNCKQARKISIKSVLQSFSLFPSKENSRTAFYFALDREEKSPSLFVDFTKNSAFDFGTGKKFDTISVVQMMKKCCVQEALDYLNNHSVNNSQNESSAADNDQTSKILQAKEIEHPALIQYLNQRKVLCQKHFLREIHYMINRKKYFGIGFKNNSDGFEVRNKYAKVCLGQKDITYFINGSRNLKVFEGFFDFLSYKKLENILEKEAGDYLILNSVFLLNRNISLLEKYEKIELFLDNDEAGTGATLQIISRFPNAEDGRLLYQDYKDLNDFVSR